MIYYASQCKGKPLTLEASGGAHSGSLTVISGGPLDNKTEPFEIGKILISDPKNPTASLLKWARDSLEITQVSKEIIAKCKARRVKDTKDVWVVDEYSANNLPKPSSDGPRSACGRFGYTQESNAYWRVAHGFSWFVDFGQDTPIFDFPSLTLITKKDGSWGPLATTTMPAQAKAPVTKNKSVVTNIANVKGAQESLYGKTRGWKVYSGHVNRTLKYCAGERDYDGTKLRIGFDGGQWQFAVPYKVSPNYYGQFEVDGKKWGMSGTADGKWAFAWVGLPELDAIRNGNVMILDIHRASFDFKLIGTAAVITKVQECLQGGE